RGGVPMNGAKCNLNTVQRVKRENTRNKTPAASASVASRNFIDDAATPPRGDARRGLSHDCDSFTLDRLLSASRRFLHSRSTKNLVALGFSPRLRTHVTRYFACVAGKRAMRSPRN